MKIEKRVPLIVIALVCLILWKDITCRRRQIENTAATASAKSTTSRADKIPLRPLETMATNTALSTLLTSTGIQLREIERLRALSDGIENFRGSAKIKNEFNNALEPAKAAFLIKNMPPDFTDSYFGAFCFHEWASAQRIDAALWRETHPSASPVTAQALAADSNSLKEYLNRLPPGIWKDNLATSASEDAYLAKAPSTVIDLLGKTTGPACDETSFTNGITPPGP
jgi:hypothetical protein